MGKNGNHGLDKPMGGLVRTRKQEDQSEITKHLVAASGEFVGTFLFLLFAFLGHSMCASQAGESGPGGTPSSQQVVFVALCYGISLLVTAWTLYRISGGLFNPAVTLGLVLTGNLPPMRGLILVPFQFLGAIAAAGVVNGIIPAEISTVETTLAPNVSIAQGLFLEMFLTSQLVFTILMLAAEKSKDTFIAPIGIGLALFIVEIAGIYYTGASVNPARSFGPCVVGANFQTYHWIYWLGPVLGACLAAAYYHFCKLFNYEDANPGQDSSGGGFDAQVERAESGTLDDMEAAKGPSGGGGQSSERGQAQGGYGQTSDRGQAQGGYGQGYGHDYGRENGPNNTSYYNEQGRPTSRSQAPRLPEMNTVQGMTDRY